MKTGRATIFDKRMEDAIQIMVPAELIVALRKRADQEKRTLSAMARAILMDALGLGVEGESESDE